MKLKKFAAAAVAMVMAVSMLSVPVWADDGNTQSNYENESETSTGTNDTYASTDNTASTEVKVFYSNSSSQLSVTVPISITLAVKLDKSLAEPSNYKIINNSYVPVHVESIKVTAENSANAYKLVNDVTSETTTNAMQLKMKPGANGTAVALLSGDSDTVTVTAGQWDIAAKTNNAGTPLDITFSDGKVNQIDESLIKTKTAAVKLFTVTYTIKAGKAATSGN